MERRALRNGEFAWLCFWQKKMSFLKKDRQKKFAVIWREPAKPSAREVSFPLFPFCRSVACGECHVDSGLRDGQSNPWVVDIQTCFKLSKFSRVPNGILHNVQHLVSSNLAAFLQSPNTCYMGLKVLWEMSYWL